MSEIVLTQKSTTTFLVTEFKRYDSKGSLFTILGPQLWKNDPSSNDCRLQQYWKAENLLMILKINNIEPSKRDIGMVFQNPPFS